MRIEQETTWRKAQYRSADTDGKARVHLKEVGPVPRGTDAGRSSWQRVRTVRRESENAGCVVGTVCETGPRATAN